MIGYFDELQALRDERSGLAGQVWEMEERHGGYLAAKQVVHARS